MAGPGSRPKAAASARAARQACLMENRVNAPGVA